MGVGSTRRVGRCCKKTKREHGGAAEKGEAGGRGLSVPVKLTFDLPGVALFPPGHRSARGEPDAPAGGWAGGRWVAAGGPPVVFMPARPASRSAGAGAGAVRGGAQPPPPPPPRDFSQWGGRGGSNPRSVPRGRSVPRRAPPRPPIGRRSPAGHRPPDGGANGAGRGREGAGPRLGGVGAGRGAVAAGASRGAGERCLCRAALGGPSAPFPWGPHRWELGPCPLLLRLLFCLLGVPRCPPRVPSCPLFASPNPSFGSPTSTACA